MSEQLQLEPALHTKGKKRKPACSHKYYMPLFGVVANYGKSWERLSPAIHTVVMLFVVIAATVVGSIAIRSACFRWARSQVFGYGGAALVIAGLILLSLSIRGVVEFRWAPVRSNPPDIAALQRIIEDGNAKTLTAVRESNRQFTERIEASQEQTLSAIQSHVLAIRTDAADRRRILGTSSGSDRIRNIETSAGENEDCGTGIALDFFGLV